MSSRANYFFVWNKSNQPAFLATSGQTVQVYFDKYPESRILGWLLGGSAAFLPGIRFIMAEKQNHKFLDEVWADAGFLYDEVNCRILFYLSDEFSALSFRRKLLPIVRAKWPGWSLDWAEGSITELATTCGLDPNLVRDELYPISECRLEALSAEQILENQEDGQQGEFFPEPRQINNFVTLRYAENSLADYSFYFNISSLLTLGENLLAILSRKAPDRLPLAHESWHSYFSHQVAGDGAIVTSGLYIDVPSRTIWAWWQRPLDNLHLENLAQFWPGWKLERLRGGLLEQVALSGRASQSLQMDEADMLAYIAKSAYLSKYLADFQSNTQR